MQTTTAPPEASETSSEQDLLQHLLQKQQPPKQQAHQPNDPVHGVVLGRVIALRTDGKLDIALDSLGIAHAIASPICAPQTLYPGISIAVMFEQGNIERALILGAMHGSSPVQGGTHVTPSPEIYVDQQRVVIAAEQELELRCGEAAIVLTADGRILTRGNYISSLATATQRIRGGAVQIN